ncbi:glycosyltransferase family 4 protein [Chitinophaga sancti]|uniref:Glycosyltransferase involved in cell wall bisynthesis n=1 Tax=Chitinophaga sancti TaxID=1004 RepID=A0A1K1RUR0_9BACT|nr:glycosyltransferase family 4 protein [Chitinophaga sancti]WQD62344.1 glycosyltransferase family 4 protein [Chitinophaga sancti]SFW75814.1 Glycosyltransferase involved in cell wall bisynthesis [Chitinophaga sancti]
MKTVLITAYAVNPYKGSEDAMGWNMILQALKNHRVIAVTRKNNQPAIEKYCKEHPENEHFDRLSCYYFDWPSWAIRWKKGPLLSMIYYYLWQLTLAIWLFRKRLNPDLVHNLNFHNDWTPSFLWILGKPFVWGHVGHHNKIPRQYILPIYGPRTYLQDRLLWVIKNIFWYADPFLWLCKHKADVIICMNNAAVEKLRLKNNFIIHPSVAADKENSYISQDLQHSFNILSVGRLVPLKGFDLTIRGFAWFYNNLPAADRAKVSLTIAGSGPAAELLHKIAREEQVEGVIKFIDWLPREEVKKLYANATLFLYPSHEGAGMVVPEAMSFGLPVICLDNDGPGKLVAPSSCLLVKQDEYWPTVKAISEKLQHLYWNSPLLAQEKLLATERHQDLFQWNVRGKMLNKVYTYAAEKNSSCSLA